MRVRRVVTGHDRNGKAVFASDQEVDPLIPVLIPSLEVHRLWGADQAPAFPGDGGPTAQPSYFPPLGGYRFGFVAIAPRPSRLRPTWICRRRRRTRRECTFSTALLGEERRMTCRPFRKIVRCWKSWCAKRNPGW